MENVKILNVSRRLTPAGNSRSYDVPTREAIVLPLVFKIQFSLLLTPVGAASPNFYQVDTILLFYHKIHYLLHNFTMATTLIAYMENNRTVSNVFWLFLKQ